MVRGALGAVRRAARTARRRRLGISYRRTPTLRRPMSQACTFDQITSSEYAAWCERLALPPLHHRKLWEWVFILRAIEAHGMIADGRRGLGFGVGNEPIAAYLAAHGCTIVASDLDADDSHAATWQATGQHAARLDDLANDALCPPEVFARAVSFRAVDMNAIPTDLAGFDFAWSSCAMEHLGTLEAGCRFVEEQLRCLRPGGVGVHTTELNVSSDDDTISDGHTVLYRRRDLEDLVVRLRARGHRVSATLALGERPEDLHVDVEPFGAVHLRTETDGFAHTSFGLIVRKGRRH